MKIQKIRFENIHSLRGEHEIDFSSDILAEAGLFAITGPTGSGKSTILDVITLALFNKIARINSTISNTTLDDDGGIMTRNTQSSYAEVEYECNGISYRSHWSVARNRNNNLNPRKQELVKISTGEILESGTKTPEKNEEIIGLSYDQFVKAIVIAQGEFSKLLKASRNERNKLLEDITGAHHYRQIGMKVYERLRNIKRDIELREANLEGIQLLTDEVVLEKKEELSKLSDQYPGALKASDKARKKVETRLELQKRLKEKEVLEKKISEYKEDFAVYKPFIAELTLHDRLIKHREWLREFDLLNKNLKDLNQAQKTLNQRISDTEKEQKNLLKTASDLTHKDLEIQSAIPELENFRKKIEELLADERLKESEALFFQNLINSGVPKISEKGYTLPSLSLKEIKHFETEFSQLKKMVSQSISESQLKSLDELEKEFEDKRKKYEKATDFLNRKESRDKLITEVEKGKEEIKKNTGKISENKKEFQNSTQRKEKLATEVKELEQVISHQKLHQSLEEQRKNLIDNEPCPLCGSLHHPYATDEIISNVKEELLVEKRQAFDDINKLLTQLETVNDSLTKENEQIREKQNVQTKDIESVEKELREIGEILNWNFQNPIEVHQENRQKLLTDGNKLNSYKKAFETREILIEIGENFNKWKQVISEFEEINKKRKSLYSGKDINREVSNLSNQINRNITQLEGFLDQFAENTENEKKLILSIDREKEVLNKILMDENLDSLEILRRGIMPEDRAQRIRNRGAELEKTKTSLAERTKLLQERLTELNKEDDAGTTLEILQENYEKLRKEAENLTLQIGQISQELKQNDEAKERQRKVLDVLKALKKDFALWKKMNDLIGDSTGNKFSHFVQDLTLRQLISYTNIRLSDFTDRYIIDPESAEGSADLYVLDNYMGRAKRSIRTLSGGETFLVSLAMAFALSDIAARNIKIESLFIDEGFGTLDPDTLDQAITVLEKMQNESNKSIGIISHVEELKKRITTQIQLEKGSLGYSELKVIQ